MKQKLELLAQRAMNLIKSPSLNDPTTIARLAPIPAKMQQMLSQITQIEEESSRMEEFLNGLTQSSPTPSPTNATFTAGRNSDVHNARAQRKKLLIRINWSLLGAPGGSEEISEHMASDSLVRFLARLHEVKGIEVLEKLSKLRVNRSFLVSKNPSKDFRYWNGSADAEYQNQPIPNSGFFALTHSDTNQKIADIKKACQFLGLPIGAVNVEQLDKYNVS